MCLIFVLTVKGMTLKQRIYSSCPKMIEACYLYHIMHNKKRVLQENVKKIWRGQEVVEEETEGVEASQGKKTCNIHR